MEANKSTALWRMLFKNLGTILTKSKAVKIDDVATKASRFEEVKDLLDEMELRWLELSEKNS